MSADAASHTRVGEGRLQRVLFASCTCASALLMWPTCREASFYARHGDPFGGGERIFVMIVMANPLFTPALAFCVLLAVAVGIYVFWKKVPRARIRLLGWMILFTAGSVGWPAPEQFGANPILFRDVVNVILLSFSIVISAASLMWPARRTFDV